jgi:hypothetical protein
MYSNKTPIGKISIWHQSDSRHVRVNEEKKQCGFLQNELQRKTRAEVYRSFRVEKTAGSTGALSQRVGAPEARSSRLCVHSQTTTGYQRERGPFLDNNQIMRQQNEQVTFGDNPFGVIDCRSQSNNGTSKYKYWNCSATAHHI